MTFPTSTLTVLLCITVAAPWALAHSDIENPAVYKRIHVMEAMEEDLITLTDMVQGRRGFDALAAEQARSRLIRHSATLPKLFKSQQMDPKTTARPVIWDNWPDFKARSTAMKQASKRLNVSTVSTLKAGLPKFEATCNACHQVYRQPVN